MRRCLARSQKRTVCARLAPLIVATASARRRTALRSLGALSAAFGCYLRESADEHARSAACAASMGELRRCMASHPESFGELDVARKVLGVAGVGRGAAAGR